MKKADREKAKQNLLTAREDVKAKKVDHLQTETEVRARLGGICRQTTYNMVKNGLLPEPLRIGSRKYWRSSVIDAWLASQQPIEQIAA